MSRPRRIRRGNTWFVTRNCTQRMFLMRPDERFNETFGYFLAHAAGQTGIKLHAFCALSNHYHLVLTDEDGRLPKFMQILDGLLARAINNLRNRFDHVWEGNSYSAVELLTPEAVFEEMVYTIANPVSSGLVHSHFQWPGWITNPQKFSQWTNVTKPKRFFRQRGLPDTLAIHTEIPKVFANEGLDGFSARLTKAIASREMSLTVLAKKLGKTFVGRRNILRQECHDTPRTSRPRRTLNPRLATKIAGTMTAAKMELIEFWTRYAQALAEFNAGRRNVIFPHGTYLLQVRHAVPCAGP